MEVGCELWVPQHGSYPRKMKEHPKEEGEEGEGGGVGRGGEGGGGGEEGRRRGRVRGARWPSFLGSHVPTGSINDNPVATAGMCPVTGSLMPAAWWLLLRRLVTPAGLPSVCLLTYISTTRGCLHSCLGLSVFRLPASACKPLKGRGLQRGELTVQHPILYEDNSQHHTGHVCTHSPPSGCVGSPLDR